MIKKAIILLLLVSAGYVCADFVRDFRREKLQNPHLDQSIIAAQANQANSTPSQLRTSGTSKVLTIPKHAFQTYNNCGPDTLSMALSFYGIDKTQKELGELMRPWQNSRGDNDDKSTSVREYLDTAKMFGLSGTNRVNGDLDVTRKLIANDLPFAVRTLHKQNEYISHYRLVKGYDDATQTIFVHDSFYGKDLKVSYTEFLAMWQPFNYEYLIIYPSQKETLVMEILGDEADPKVAFENAIVRANEELAGNADSMFIRFNLVTSYFGLGRYDDAIAEFEKIESRVPSMVFWYQFQPIKAYAHVGNKNRVFSLTQTVLDHGNRAASELYQIRGEMLVAQGDINAARNEFNNAIKYKYNYQPAIDALAKLN